MFTVYAKMMMMLGFMFILHICIDCQVIRSSDACPSGQDIMWHQPVRDDMFQPSGSEEASLLKGKLHGRESPHMCQHIQVPASVSNCCHVCVISW